MKDGNSKLYVRVLLAEGLIENKTANIVVPLYNSLVWLHLEYLSSYFKNAYPAPPPEI